MNVTGTTLPQENKRRPGRGPYLRPLVHTSTRDPVAPLSELTTTTFRLLTWVETGSAVVFGGGSLHLLPPFGTP